MSAGETVTHPWMANSVAAIKARMLAEIGAASIEELFEQIPAEHRLRRPLDLPPGLRAEADLRRHLTTLLKRNETCEDNLNFLGAGCWQHHVPAVVDEIVGRYEFLTNVWGSPQSDFGRNQAWFEYASQLGELVGMEVVSLPVYSWGCAAGHAIRMAARITGRHEVLVPRIGDPERLSVIRSYCEPPEMARHIDVVHGRGRSRDGPARSGRPRGQALAAHRRGLCREPVLHRRDRGRGRRDRPARPPPRRAAHRRRRPDLAGCAEGARRLRRRHRRRPDPDAGRAHERRRRRRRLHRLARRGALHPRV